MVRLLIIISVLTIFGCSSDDNGRIGRAEKSKTPLDIESIKIVHNGGYSEKISSDESAEMCGSFILSESEVLMFFTTARSVTLREYEHDLNASSCYSSGTFVSKNGVIGEWKIDRSRRGFLYSESYEPEYYFCPECKSELYYESCDIDCIHTE